MRTPILETERLILRPMKAEDAQEVFDNWAGDPDVAKFMVWSRDFGCQKIYCISCKGQS